MQQEVVMGKLWAVMGAALKCSQGVAPSSLVVIRPTLNVGGMAGATVMDFAPIVNIPPFGMCNSTSNPMVISATSAAMGVHTPMPCIPVTTGPWSPGASKVKAMKMKALTKDCKCRCSWNGEITITNAGQTKVKVN